MQTLCADVVTSIFLGYFENVQFEIRDAVTNCDKFNADVIKMIATSVSQLDANILKEILMWATGYS